MSDSTREPGRIVILTGAGSSYYAGVPMMDGMIKKFESSETISAEAKRTMRLLGEAGIKGDLENTLLQIQVLQELPAGGPLQAVLKRLGSSIAKAPMESKKIAKLRDETERLEEEIRQFMANSCYGFKREEAGRVWGDLVRLLEEHDITIFTTNYDYVIEDTAIKNGINVVDNFKIDTGNRSFWDHTLTAYDQQGLRVVKLHGSVNWYATDDLKTIEKLSSDSNKNWEGEDIHRLVVFPTKFKDIYSGIFFSLYQQFLRELEQAKILIIIGHSLRDDYIRAAIRESFRRDDFVVVYIGPKMPPALKELSLPDINVEERIIRIEDKFEDAAGRLAYVLESRPLGELRESLVELAGSDKTNKLQIKPAPTYLKPGVAKQAKLVVKAPAIPPASIEARLLPKEGDGKIIDIVVRDPSTSEPVRIEGMEEMELAIEIEAPADSVTGEYEMEVSLRGGQGTPLVTHSYVCYLGVTKAEAEEQPAEPGGDDTPADSSAEQGEPPSPAPVGAV